MLHVDIFCIGKLKEKFYFDAVEEYTKRLGGFCKLGIHQLPEQRLPDNPSPAQIDAALSKEGQALLEKLPKGAWITALCVEGQLYSSQQLAQQLNRWATGGDSRLCFLIGGSYGLSPAVKQRSHLRLSMSPMTFPHHLARVMLLEQLYRAFQIGIGSSYHK